MASRRLIDDQLFDQRPGNPVQAGRCALRIRRDGTRGFLTFKGPPQPGAVKIREEFETEISNIPAMEAIVAALGYTPFFRAQKWREEFTAHGCIIALDDTPMGVFVEIEGAADAIERVSMEMGRERGDWQLGSYQRLFAQWATARGLSPDAMLLPYL